MPQISRLFLKAGIIYFIVALIAGFWLQWDVAVATWLNPLFWHMLTVGWITQIIFGVSHWMFPLRTRDEGIIAQKYMWMAFIALNTGLLLRIIAEPMLLFSQWPGWDYLIIASACLQVIGGIAYMAEMWPRVLSKKQQIRARKARRKS